MELVAVLHGWIAGNGFPYEHSGDLPDLGQVSSGNVRTWNAD